jgi:hypothetical protein
LLLLLLKLLLKLLLLMPAFLTVHSPLALFAIKQQAKECCCKFII